MFVLVIETCPFVFFFYIISEHPHPTLTCQSMGEKSVMLFFLLSFYAKTFLLLFC
jgi:hypothetical protein